MVGYILLIAITVAISLIVYQFIRTYVPTESLECPEGASVFIEKTEYGCDTNALNVTIKNNGLFDIAGYFIHATTSANQELATEDLSDKLSGSGITYSNSVLFVAGKNALSPGQSMKMKFTDVGDIYKIEIIPVRFQEEDGKIRFASCSNTRVEETLVCIE